MADEHSQPGGMKVLRLYADALGESRFETTTMPMALKEFAPPAAPLRVSDPQPAQNYVILEVGAKWGGAVPHPSPARMMAFSLSGCTRVTASSGESHTFVAGDCLLHDNTSGWEADKYPSSRCVRYDFSAMSLLCADVQGPGRSATRGRPLIWQPVRLTQTKSGPGI